MRKVCVWERGALCCTHTHTRYTHTKYTVPPVVSGPPHNRYFLQADNIGINSLHMLEEQVQPFPLVLLLLGWPQPFKRSDERGMMMTYKTKTKTKTKN